MASLTNILLAVRESQKD